LVLLFALAAFSACLAQVISIPENPRSFTAPISPNNSNNNNNNQPTNNNSNNTPRRAAVELLRNRATQFRREVLQAVNGMQAVREGFANIEAALQDSQGTEDLPTLIRAFNAIDNSFTSVVSNIEEISRGAREGRADFRRIQFGVRRLISDRANGNTTMENDGPTNVTRTNVFELIIRIPVPDQQQLLETIQTNMRQNMADLRQLILPALRPLFDRNQQRGPRGGADGDAGTGTETGTGTASGERLANLLGRARTGVTERIRSFRTASSSSTRRPLPNSNSNTNSNTNTNTLVASNNNPANNNNVARALGEEEYLTDEQLAAAAFTDDEIALAFGDDTTFVDEQPSLALDIEAVAFASSEDDADSSDFAIQADSGTFDSAVSAEVPSFAIEESGDFAAIEEEALAFALEENLESSAAMGEENLQFFTEDDVVAAAVLDGDRPGDVAVTEDVTAATVQELPVGDRAVADFPVADQLPADLTVQLPADLAVTDPLESDRAVADFPVADQLPADLTVQLPADLAVTETVVENLVLDDPEAALAAASDPTTLTKTSSTTPLPSGGIALIVIGSFIAIACILVVIQLFIYFRSA